jgi:hypothetical protein
MPFSRAIFFSAYLGMLLFGVSLTTLGSVASMVINYLMGLIVSRYGVQYLIAMGFVLTACMFVFSLAIEKK